MRKSEKIFLGLVYFMINWIFIFKYAIRQDYINVYLLFLIFPLFIFALYSTLNKFKFEPKHNKTVYLSIVILFFLFTIGLNLYVDGNNLNVDRWSAMEVSVTAILEGNYPYMQLDHLNGRSSNLPGLILIGIPFYIMGDVGYLQCFTFLLFAYTIYKTIDNFKAKIIGLLLLISSPFYLWEIYVKSDLMSNFIIVLCFIILWYKKYNNRVFEKPIVLGTIASFIFYTRLISIIPLTLLLFNAFIKSAAVKKVLFLTASIFTIFILSFIVLKNCSSISNFENYNPFYLQNRQLPFYISMITILIPFYYSKKSRSFFNLIKYSFILISIPVFISFLLSNIEYGIHVTILKSMFDISYFNIFTPFLIYYIALCYDKILNSRKLEMNNNNG